MIFSALVFILNSSLCLATSVIWREFPACMYRNLGLYAGDSYSLTLQIENLPAQNASFSYDMVLFGSGIILGQKVTVLDQEQNFYRIDFGIPLNVPPGIHQFAVRYDGELLDGLSRHVRILSPLHSNSVDGDRLFSLCDDIMKQFGGISEGVALSKVSKKLHDPLKRGRNLLQSQCAKGAIA